MRTATRPIAAGDGPGVVVPSRWSTRAWLDVAEAIHAALVDPLFSEAAYPSGAVVDGASERAVEVTADVLLAELFEQESAALVRLARLFTDDRNAAEDLVQEAFVRLHHAVGRIRDRGRAAAYLRSIVLNLARDHNRRGLMSLRHFEAPTPQTADGPDDRIVLDEQQASLVRALQALSPQQRDCLVLRFYLELSEQETADTLAISPNSVKTHVRRGLEHLRTRLGDRS